MFEHKGRDGGYARGRDFLSLQFLRALDIRLGQQPLMHAVVDCHYHLQRSVTPGQHDQSAGAGDRKVNASRHQCLNTRRRFDESDLEVDSLFLHVAPVQSDGINQMLKALARNREVYGLRRRRLYAEKQQYRKGGPNQPRQQWWCISRHAGQSDRYSNPDSHRSRI